MVNNEHLGILKQGVAVWNSWRDEHSDVIPDLIGSRLNYLDLRNINFSGADLAGARFIGTKLLNASFIGSNLDGANLSAAYLTGARLVEADLTNANLAGAELTDATLICARLNYANLTRAGLRSAYLGGADFRLADLSDANLTETILHEVDLRGAFLSGANLTGAEFKNTNLANARLGRTVFADTDLREVSGLDEVIHLGPSEVGVSTIYRSEGQIPEGFLRGCGVPDEFILQIPALAAAIQPIQFYSCFISFSSGDEEFARRLHSRMRQAGLRVWFAPEDMKGGEKIYEQIDRAIQLHDRLLLVLSENSMKSEWVATEIRRARKAQVRESRRKLFPIRLVDFNALKEWECFDADQGSDLAVELRELFIPDFSNWKSHDDFEQAFARLHDDLKASA